MLDLSPRPDELEPIEPRADAADLETRTTSGAALAALVKDNAGVTVGVDVLEPGLLERSAGKAQRLLDLR
jgi:phenylacetate-CoA ligase